MVIAASDDGWQRSRVRLPAGLVVKTVHFPCRREEAKFSCCMAKFLVQLENINKMKYNT